MVLDILQSLTLILMDKRRAGKPGFLRNRDEGGQSKPFPGNFELLRTNKLQANTLKTRGIDSGYSYGSSVRGQW